MCTPVKLNCKDIYWSLLSGNTLFQKCSQNMENTMSALGMMFNLCVSWVMQINVPKNLSQKERLRENRKDSGWGKQRQRCGLVSFSDGGHLSSECWSNDDLLCYWVTLRQSLSLLGSGFLTSKCSTSPTFSSSESCYEGQTKCLLWRHPKKVKAPHEHMLVVVVW